MKTAFSILSFLSIFLTAECFVVTPPESMYEITGHRARIHLFPSEGTIRCSDTVTVRRSGEGKGAFRFELSLLHRVEKVVLNGEEIRLERTREGFSIEASKLEEENQVVVEFSGNPSGNPELSRLNSERAVLRAEDLLIRGTHAYSFTRLTIVVPRDWEAVATGMLALKRTVGDSAEFVWASQGPLPDIGWICAGKYAVTSLTVDSISFSIYLFERDSLLAQELLGFAKRVTKFYGEQFSPYRFSKLAIVEVDDWFGGPFVLAAAIPSVIFVKRTTLKTEDDFNKVQSLLPHEIAHQWWPQTIYVRDEDAAFLSEGLCEYAARLYDESVGTTGPRSAWKSHPLLRPLILRAIRGKEVPLNRAADLRALPTHYLKAAYIHHMLRGIVGDSIFRRIYREFAQRFQVKTVGMKEFQNLAEEVSGKPLGWFFQQWILETGLPRLKLYNVRASQGAKDWRVQGRIRLVGYKSYTTPVTIGVATEAGIARTSVWLGRDSTKTVKNDLPFEVRTESKPLRVVVDPYGDLLKMQKMPVRLSDLREPSNGLMIVGTRRLAGRLLELARRDSAELAQSGWSVRIKPDTASTLSDYRSERVFLYGSPSMNSIAAQIGRRFPIACDDGKCLWNSKVYTDTSLSVTQIIDNPFQEQALLCWIVPLGDSAQPVLRPLDASAVIARRGEVVESWTWSVKDEELEVEIEE